MIRPLITCLVVVWLWLPQPALACPHHPHNWQEHALRIEALGDTGLIIVYQDTNGDEVADRALVFQLQDNGDLFEWPLFYFYGLDAEGRAEEVWIDHGVEGMCWQIELYYKRHIAH